MELCLSETVNGEFKRYYRRMHRFIFETIYGDIPDDLTVDHKNMNKRKNNSENLRLLTRGENSSLGKEFTIYRYILYNGNSCIGLVNRLELEYIIEISLDDLGDETFYNGFNWKRIG